MDNTEEIQEEKSDLQKLLSILLVVFIIGSIWLIVMFFQGYRIFSEDCTTFEKENVINGQDYDFYYFTIPVVNENDEQISEFIEGFIPVKRHGLFYKAEDYYYPLYELYYEDHYVGILYEFEDNGIYHYFFKQNMMQIYVRHYMCKTINVNDNEVEFYIGSYFKLDEKIKNLILDEKELEIKDYSK